LRKKDGKHRTAYIAAESGDSLLCFFDLLIGINHEYGALLCFLWAFCVSSRGILSLARPVWKTSRAFVRTVFVTWHAYVSLTRVCGSWGNTT
jgi:hypothetical protein